MDQVPPSRAVARLSSLALTDRGSEVRVLFPGLVCAWPGGSVPETGGRVRPHLQEGARLATGGQLTSLLCPAHPAFRPGSIKKLQVHRPASWCFCSGWQGPVPWHSVHPGGVHPPPHPAGAEGPLAQRRPARGFAALLSHRHQGEPILHPLGAQAPLPGPPSAELTSADSQQKASAQSLKMPRAALQAT